MSKKTPTALDAGLGGHVMKKRAIWEMGLLPEIYTLESHTNSQGTGNESEKRVLRVAHVRCKHILVYYDFTQEYLQSVHLRISFSARCHDWFLSCSEHTTRFKPSQSVSN